MSDHSFKDAAKNEIKEQIKAKVKADKDSLKQLIKSLKPEQRDELLRRLTSVAHEQAEAMLAGAGKEGSTDIPLSFAQEREWFRDRLFPGVAHNIAGALRLTGTLSLPALQATLAEIVRRHEPLRASITAPDGRPQQSIRPFTSFAIEVVEGGDWRELYAEEMVRPFDLERDLLLRAKLIRTAPAEHMLLITLHHIAADGWSIGIVMRELAELYRAFARGKSSPLTPLPLTYGEFARWQRERTQGRALEDGLAYWRGQLENLPPALELAPDRLLHGAAAERDHDAASSSARIGRTLKRELEELSRREDATLFVTLLTAFMVLMMRCTGREDVLIGSPVSGRTRVDVEGLVGLFLNTLALRAALPPSVTFLEAMGVVRKCVLDALEFGEVPVEKIVQSLDTQRSATVHPLYETIFNFTPSAPRRVELPDLTASLEDPPALIEEFSTQLFVTDLDGELELDLRYRSRRYSEARMDCFLEQYTSLLEQLVREPVRSIGAFDLVTPRSRALLPNPAAPLDAPLQRTVTECMREWIARTPDAPAIEQGAERLTYAQFGERIASVVRELRAGGMQQGDVIAVSGPRSIEVIVRMAAVLEAGGVLLTLSPDLPEQRRQTMLQEAGTRHEPGAAYIFFTSGSTGRPKGVLGTHQGLGHWLAWQRETFGIGPGDRCGHLTGLSFDVVLRDVFLALTSGATLVIPPPDEPVLPWLDRERITVTHTVPAVAESWLLERSGGIALASLRRIFFAGEPLTSSLVTRWREAFPRAGEIINLYGPTETTLAKCCYVVPAHPRAGIQPLGRPLPQTQVLVLTPSGAQCGVGEPGEIAIRTPFRTRGYVNAAEENAKRFVGDLYLTGDRGVIGADGLLEFRGRADHQVKIRGVRVEPMEVTVTLQSAPGVASCAVIARDDGDGPALVAYVVRSGGAAEDPAALRDFLGQRLPAAMVPSAFVFLEALPLTPNQKLDRDRLPAPSQTRPAVRYVAPRDLIELRLVQIWEELLGAQPIGVTDRFFDAGGHSLLALRLLVEIERRIGRKVPLAALFEEPTIEHLAAVLRRHDDEWPLLVTLRGGDAPLDLFLVHPGGGTLLNYVHLLRHLPPGIAVHGIQARGLDGTREPHDSLEQMAADYLDEIHRVQSAGPYLLAGHSMGGVIAFEIARQLRARGESIAFLGLFDSVAPSPVREPDAGLDRRQDAMRLMAMAEAIGRFFGQTIELSLDALSELPADAQIEAVVAALERTRALPPGEEQKLMRNLLAVSKAHIRAHRAYEPRPAEVPITLFRVHEVEPSDYPSATAEILATESLGWEPLTTDRLRIVRTEGNHVTMLSAAHAEGLARLLHPCLLEAVEIEGEVHA